MRTIRYIALASALTIGGAAVLAACGSGNKGSASAKGRVIPVTMEDIRYSPTELRVAAGETVTFRFTNRGEARHEAFIGTLAEQEAHAQEMKSSGTDMGSMPMGNDSKPVLTVDPGKTADLVYTAGPAGSVLIGCHQPGHWEAGMRATVTIT